MTFKIASDELGGVTPAAFAEQVAARLATLREYDAHEATVRAHAADETMKPEDRWVTLAVPEAPALVSRAIYTTFNPDGTHLFAANYEIVPPLLDKRKAALFEQVNAAEHAAMAAVVPAGKVRAYHFREADIQHADQARYAEALRVHPDPGNIMAFAEFAKSTRAAADTEFLDAQAARAARRQRIMRWAANLHSEIEDLTEETVGRFDVGDFRE